MRPPRRPRPLGRWLAAAVAALLTVLLLAPRSEAGVYHVYSCRIPYGPLEGQAAPVENGEDAPGWSHAVVGNAQYGNSCADHGALIASLQAGTSHTDADLATWQFDAASGERVTQATLWFAGNADGGNGYLFWLASPENPAVKDAMAGDDFVTGCVYILGCRSVGTTAEPLASANKVTVPSESLGGSHLYINASCSSASCPSNNGDEQGHAVVVYVYATDIALEEQSSPTVSDVTGELVDAGDLSGTASLFFQAADPGSGVYKETVRVDGQVTESQIVDETGLCKEVPVPSEDGPAFLSAQPCPAEANGHVSLDTDNLANGAHHLLVEVTNAAGNAATVISRTIDVANASSPTGNQPGGGSEERQPASPESQPVSTALTGLQTVAGAQVNGTPASEHPTLIAAWKAADGARIGGSNGSQLSAAFDRAETIAGRLTGPGGEPISGATIEVGARDSYERAPAVSLGSARTGPDGRFAFRLGKNRPSESITLSYTPTRGGEPVVSQIMRLRVQAEVELQVSPGSVSAGDIIHLRGRILGRPIPPGGKQIVLEARSKGSPWLQFLVLRSGRSGRFAGTHRFRLPGPVRYSFRAVCPKEADFPFQTGASKEVAVWER